MLSRYTYQLWGFMELNAANDVDAARKIYVRGTKLCPNAACLWRALADLEDREAHPIEAQKYFCEAAMADPRDPCIWHAWGCMEVRISLRRLYLCSPFRFAHIPYQTLTL